MAALPVALQTVREFANTLDVDADVDLLETPEQFAAWLEEQGLAAAPTVVTAQHLERARAVRAALRTAMESHAGHGDDEASALSQLNDLARELPLHVRFGNDATAELDPAVDGVDAVLAGVLADVRDAMRDGTWSRLKICRDDACQWVYYDGSRNRSGRWCSMAVCGNRQKVRAYRERLSAEE